MSVLLCVSLFSVLWLRFKCFFRWNLGVFCRRARWLARVRDFEVVKVLFDGVLVVFSEFLYCNLRMN